jgi:hypothetical protein
MARTTPNRGWAYPDFEQNPYDTTIVGFFNAQDADVQALRPTIELYDAKGDLLVGSAANTPARLGVGTDGQALVADSTQATGLRWGTVTGGGGVGGSGAAGQVGYFTAGTTLGSSAKLLFADTTPALASIVGGSLRLTVTDPTLNTVDFSFGPGGSIKGLAVDVVFNTTIGVGIVGQVDLPSTAAPVGGGSAQGVSGVVRAASASEVYGVMGYVDWQHNGALGAGVLALSRGMLSDLGIDGYQNGFVAISEGSYSGSCGLAVNASNPPTNDWRQGIRIDGSIDFGVRVLGSAGVGIAIVNKNVAGVDAKVALFLCRAYDTVGDSQEIVFGIQGTGLFNPAENQTGALKMLATGAGEMALTISAQTAAGNGYTNELARFEGNGTTRLVGLGGTGTRYVTATSTGVLGTGAEVGGGGLGGGLWANYTQSNNLNGSSTAEQTFNKSVTLAANALAIPGTLLEVEAGGYFSTGTSTNTVSGFIKIDGNVFSAAGLNLNAGISDYSWYFRASGLVRADRSVWFVPGGFLILPAPAAAVPSAGAFVVGATPVLNYTAALGISMSMQWTTADAGADIVMRALMARVMTPTGTSS